MRVTLKIDVSRLVLSNSKIMILVGHLPKYFDVNIETITKETAKTSERVMK